jgi:hypothetical protein
LSRAGSGTRCCALSGVAARASSSAQPAMERDSIMKCLPRVRNGIAVVA